MKCCALFPQTPQVKVECQIIASAGKVFVSTLSERAKGALTSADGLGGRAYARGSSRDERVY